MLFALRRLAVGLAWSVAAAAAEPTTSFAPDSDTLLLCHFDHGLEADLAAGDPRADGHAALVPGGAGGTLAVSLRRGLAASLEGVVLPFRPLTWDLVDNLDPARGTIELWYRPEFSERRATGQTNHFLLDIRRGTAEGAMLLIVVAEDGTRQLEFFERSLDQPERALVVDVTDWRPGEWHHLALTWEGAQRRLWVDGRCAARHDAGPPRLQAAGDVIRLGGVRWNAHFADGLVDELRISKTVRYAAE